MATEVTTTADVAEDQMNNTFDLSAFAAAEKKAQQATQANPEAAVQADEGTSVGREATSTQEATQERRTAEGVSGGQGDVDPALLTQAERYGLSGGLAKKLSAAGLLNSFLVEQDRRMTTQAARPNATEQTVAQAEPAKEPEPLIQPFKVELNPEEYDEAIVGTLQKMSDHYAKAINETNAQARAVAKVLAARAEEEELDWFNTSIAELGEEAKALYGAQNMLDLAPDSPEIAARDQLWRFYHALERAESEIGVNTPSKQLLQRAYRAVHAEQAEKDMTRKLSKQVRDANSGRFVNRPTQRQGPPPESPRQAGIDAIAGYLKAKGIHVGETDYSNLLDTVPK